MLAEPGVFQTEADGLRGVDEEIAVGEVRLVEELTRRVRAAGDGQVLDVVRIHVRVVARDPHANSAIGRAVADNGHTARETKGR